MPVRHGRENGNGAGKMNKENIVLRMDANEADKVAFVLMAALRTTSMLDNERVTACQAANSLFEQLNYEVRTDANGRRIETR
jgi:hypothetical protein